jgi:ATP-dependent DNA ligase
MAQIKADAAKIGDLGIVAEQSRSNQKLMFRPAALTVQGVYHQLSEIAKISGQNVSGVTLLICCTVVPWRVKLIIILLSCRP